MSKEYNHLPVTQQPKPAMMDATIKSEQAPRCCHGHVAFVNTATGHPKSHNSCFQRLIFPTALAAFVLLAGLFALSLSRGYLNLSDLELDNLLPRATSSSSGSPFVKNKLYLVVLFVGLLVVIGLGICLTFWCCRGSFQNPLCCPCYLCACCGGLVCLECIGCGLCVEAAEQV